MRYGSALLLASALSLGAVQVASASDIPVKAAVHKAPAAVVAYNWTGVYVGGNVGGAWSRNCFTYQSASNYNYDDGCHSASSVIGGGQIGVNWQRGPLVFGIEAAGDWTDLKGSNISTHYFGETVNSHTTAIYMATARAGYARGSSLFYVKGGAAWVRNEFWREEIPPTGAVFGQANETRLGWLVGGGWEYGFLSNWSVAAEYDYLGMGKRTLAQNYAGGCDGGAPCNEDYKQHIHMATVRLNYRFGWMRP